jgi:DNA repair exonuclease SbcCD ATPase subunit
LHIENFKGIREMQIDFSHTTHIKGRNEMGKTTIFDAFSWLLFGKDSLGNRKFNFKPHETDHTSPNYGQAIHNLSTAVTVIFYVSDTEIKLKKVSEESWVRKNGQGHRVYQGNVLTCYCEDKLKKMKEFEAIVDGLVDEDKFRILTDPLFFGRQHWEDQRKIVIDVVGDPDFEEVIERNHQLKKLEEITEGGPIQDLKKQLKGEIKVKKDDLGKMPAQIEEAMHVTSVGEAVDPEGIRKRKTRLAGEIEDLQGQLAERADANEKRRSTISALITRQNEIEREAEKTKNDQREGIQNKIDETKATRDNLTSSIRDKESEIVRQGKEVKSLEKSRGEASFYLEQKEKEHNEILERLAEIEQQGKTEVEAIGGMELLCPVCNQVLPKDQAEENREKRIRASREMTKVKLDTVNEREFALAKDIERMQFEVSEYGDRINGYKALKGQYRRDITEETVSLAKAIEGLKEEREELAHLEEPKEIGKARIEINVLQSRIDDLRKDLECDSDDIRMDLQRKTVEIDSCTLQIARYEMHEEQRKHVFELHEEQRQLKDKLDELKEYETLCDQFIIENVCMLGDRVRETFGGVEFKLYDLLINGSVSPTCEVLVKGVPWRDANNGHKIVSGIKIINALSEHYGIRVPIFIDNREAVNDCYIPSMKSQSIHLFVTDDPELNIEEVRS